MFAPESRTSTTAGQRGQRALSGWGASGLRWSERRRNGTRQASNRFGSPLSNASRPSATKSASWAARIEDVGDAQLVGTVPNRHCFATDVVSQRSLSPPTDTDVHGDPQQLLERFLQIHEV